MHSSLIKMREISTLPSINRHFDLRKQLTTNLKDRALQDASFIIPY